MGSEKYLPKISKDFLDTVNAASEEAVFNVLVKYVGPPRPEIPPQERRARREEIFAANKSYLEEQQKYYQENALDHHPLNALCMISARVKKGHLHELLEDKEVKFIADGDRPVKLVR